MKTATYNRLIAEIKRAYKGYPIPAKTGMLQLLASPENYTLEEAVEICRLSLDKEELWLQDEIRNRNWEFASRRVARIAAIDRAIRQAAF